MDNFHEYHPDKNNQATTGLTTDEATEFFKLLNNANEHLKRKIVTELLINFIVSTLAVERSYL